jgi:hypothetical protein
MNGMMFIIFITEQHWKQRGLKNGVLRGGDSGDNLINGKNKEA